MINTNLINKILHTAVISGGDFAEVFIEDKYNTNVLMNNDVIENGITARDYGVGIRVFRGNNYVYTFTNNDTEENLIKITKQVCKVLKYDDIREKVLLPEKAEKSWSEVNKYFSKTSYNDKLDVIKTVIKAGRQFDTSIERMQVKYLDQEQNVIIANTEGLYKEDKRFKTRLLISAFAMKNGVLQSGYIGPGASRGFEFYDKLDLEYYGKEAARSALVMAGADYCPSGQMSVVVDKGFGGLMFHEACGHSLEASCISKGNSEFTGKIGQKIASDVVTLIDDGSITNEWGSSNIDDEGTKTRTNVLIENGVLKTYLFDKFNARKMGTVSNGSGRRESYKFAPTSRMSNTFIAKGKSTKEEIINNTESGLFVQGINAGSVNPVTGEFNFSVSEAYLIKEGKLDKPVKGATLIGTGGNILKQVDMVADNTEIGQGYCYAGSGALYIGAGQPTVRVTNMTVGGIEE